MFSKLSLSHCLYNYHFIITKIFDIIAVYLSNYFYIIKLIHH